VIQENEISTMLIGLGIVIYILLNFGRISRIPFSKLLQTSFLFLWAGYILTVAEGFFLNGFLNLLEHACYASSSVLAAWWCYRAFPGSRKA